MGPILHTYIIYICITIEDLKYVKIVFSASRFAKVRREEYVYFGTHNDAGCRQCFILLRGSCTKAFESSPSVMFEI